MSGAQLDLDEVMARAIVAANGADYDAARVVCGDVPALVAEVRRLREATERLEALLRLLVDEGHVSPQGAREIRKTIRGEESA